MNDVNEGGLARDMSKREWFAGMAMQGLLAGNQTPENDETLATWSANAADALLAELATPPIRRDDLRQACKRVYEHVAGSTDDTEALKDVAAIVTSMKSPPAAAKSSDEHPRPWRRISRDGAVYVLDANNTEIVVIGLGGNPESNGKTVDLIIAHANQQCGCDELVGAAQQVDDLYGSRTGEQVKAFGSTTQFICLRDALKQYTKHAGGSK